MRQRRPRRRLRPGWRQGSWPVGWLRGSRPGRWLRWSWPGGWLRGSRLGCWLRWSWPVGWLRWSWLTVGWLRGSLLGSWLRRWWPDRNPLRRGSDRAEAVVLGSLVAAFLAGAPLAGLAASHAAYATTLRTANEQRSSSQQVHAVLLADAPGLLSTGYGGLVRPSVPARWTGPGGKTRTGDVPAPAHARAGSTVTVWTDGAGRLTLAPIKDGQAPSQSLLAAAFAVSSLGLLLMCTGVAVRYRFDCRRMAALDAEWRAVAPQWSNRFLASGRPPAARGQRHW